MVDIAKFFLEFTVDEILRQMHPLPHRHQAPAGDPRTSITEGNGTMEDIDKLEELCHYIKENALCGLGQTAPNPVLSTLTLLPR